MGTGFSVTCHDKSHDILGFPNGSDGKESACNAGKLDSIPGLGRSPGKANGNPLHSWYSCLEWVFLPGKFHGQRHLVGYSPWSCKESGKTE